MRYSVGDVSANVDALDVEIPLEAPGEPSIERIDFFR